MPRFEAPSLLDNLKGMWRSLISGTGMRPGVTYRHIRQAQTERLAREADRSGGWYSRYSTADGKIHVMLDRNGNQTRSYPHVHVIHDERGDEVRIVLSRGPSDHPDIEVLPATASGNEVDGAIARMLRKL